VPVDWCDSLVHFTYWLRILKMAISSHLRIFPLLSSLLSSVLSFLPSPRALSHLSARTFLSCFHSRYWTLHTIGTADEQIGAALRDGLSRDNSGIDSKPVYRGLGLNSKRRYIKI